MAELTFHLRVVDGVSPALERLKRSTTDVATRMRKDIAGAFEGPKKFARSAISGGDDGGGGFLSGIFSGSFMRKKKTNEDDGGEGGGGFLGGFMGGGKTGGGVGKAAGGLMGIFALTEIAKTALGFLKKIVGVLSEASPMLSGTLKMIYKSLLLWLQPIGDMLALVLMPIARFFLGLRAKYNEQIYGYIKEGKFLEASLFMIGATIVEGVSAIGGWLVETLTGVVDWGWDALSSLGTSIFDWIIEGIGSAGDVLGNLATTIYDWVVEGFSGFVDSLASLVDAFIGGMVTSIANIEIPVLGKPLYGFMKDWFPQYFEEVVKRLSVFPTDEYRGWLQQIQTAPAPVSSAQEWRAILQGGGITPMGNETNINVDIHINAPIYGVDDLNEAITRGIDDYASRIRLA